MTPREWGLLLALALVWGGSFFFVEVALRALPPLTIVTLRVGLAAVALHVLLRAVGQRLGRGRLWAHFFGMSLLNNVVPFSLLAWGQTQIPSGLASILNATTPVFTVVVAHLLTPDEKMTRNRLAGVLLGLVGVAVLIGPDALEGLGGNVAAQAACLAAAFSYALAAVFGRRFERLGVPPLATATGQVTASTVVLLPLALVVDRPWRLAMPGVEIWTTVASLALLSTALAYVLYFRILATAGATNLLLVTLLIPVSAILLGSLVLGERLDPVDFLGLALIGLALAAIDGRPLAVLG
jgi:drug/metabolite transporter (DMT)-like permease